MALSGDATVAPGLVASGDLSAKQWKFMKHHSTAGQVVTCGAGEKGIGVLENAPDAAGEIAEVAVAGRSKVTLGGTVAAGNLLKSDASGDAVLADGDGDFAIARAEAAGVDNDVIPVTLVPQTYIGAADS